MAHVMKNPASAEKVTAPTDLVNEIGLDSLRMIDFFLSLGKRNCKEISDLR